MKITFYQLEYSPRRNKWLVMSEEQIPTLKKARALKAKINPGFRYPVRIGRIVYEHSVVKDHEIK